jgi:hypothetical protein
VVDRETLDLVGESEPVGKEVTVNVGNAIMDGVTEEDEDGFVQITIPVVMAATATIETKMISSIIFWDSSFVSSGTGSLL